MRYPAALLVLAGMLGAASPVWATSFTGAYAAGNTNANAAPPSYILRLDGVFGGGIATFNEHGVAMEILANGSARLFGTVAVGKPGAPDPAFGSLWDLDTTWNPAGMSASEQFFRLEPGVLRNQADPLNDFILLAHRGMPARVGSGVFPDGKCVSTGGTAPCFGFAGWVSYEHHLIGGGNRQRLPRLRPRDPLAAGGRRRLHPGTGARRRSRGESRHAGAGRGDRGVFAAPARQQVTLSPAPEACRHRMRRPMHRRCCRQGRTRRLR